MESHDEQKCTGLIECCSCPLPPPHFLSFFPPFFLSLLCAFMECACLSPHSLTGELTETESVGKVGDVYEATRLVEALALDSVGASTHNHYL